MIVRTALTLLLIFSIGQAQENLLEPVALIRSGDHIGAAFIVGERGDELYLLSAAHVIEDVSDITVEFRGFSPQPARNFHSDPDLDIATFSCSRPAGFSPLFYSFSTEVLKDDEPVIIIGHPLGNNWDINKLNQVKESAFGIIPGRFSVSPTGIGAGSSGGPVLDANGQLLGLITEVDQVKTTCVQVDVLLRACKKWAVPVNGKKISSPNSESPPVKTPGKTYIDPLAGTLVHVPGGTFTMGSNESKKEKPPHAVTVSDFYFGKYEVTQAQWKAVMGTNPSYFKNCDQCPVEQVSWDDVQEFLQKLNQQTGQQYRLPTEAEWEYAAGGGSSGRTKWAGTNSESSLGDYAWYFSNSDSKTHPVGKKKPNGLGLYDMSGNVREWCSDWMGAYSSGAQTNPRGPSRGAARVDRGGGWIAGAAFCRVTARSSYGPSVRYDGVGFRLARSF